MKATEIRIGNWVVSDNQDPTQQPYQVEARHFADDILDDRFYADPISLTEEWLVRFGFVREPWERRFMNGVASWTHPEAESEFAIEEYQNPKQFCVGVFDRTISVDFVHELQNWWFLAEGFELEFTKQQ